MLGRVVRALLIAFGCLALAGVAQVVYLGWKINWTGAHDRAQPADAIVILGAMVEADGQAGPDLTSRTRHAVDLFQRGLAPILICTGGYEGDRLSAAAVARRLAISQGVAPDRILLAEGSMTTQEDAASTRALMAAHGLKTAILVSHPLHLERARLLFQAEGITVYPSPTNVNLNDIPWPSRARLTAREAAGIAWIGLEALGLPQEWTDALARRFYGPPNGPGPR